MSDFLAQMAARSRARADGAVVAAPLPTRATVPLASDGAFTVIAEIKRVSPAEGELGSSDDIVARAKSYVAGGAAAISVLTEPSRFGGSLDDLAAVAAALPDVPVMRKDFLVDTVQIDEAYAQGASGVLLIAAMLDDAALAALATAAVGHGLFVLLEAFDRNDLERIDALLNEPALAAARAAGQLLAGVNARDLRTLAVDPERFAALAPLLPAGVPAIAESGIVTAADAAAAAALGFSGALVGTALMRASQPAAVLAAMQNAVAGVGL